VKFLAARRIGELVPPVEPRESGRMAHNKMSEVRTPDIPKQRLSEFRKLAEIAMKGELPIREERWKIT